MVTSQRHRPVAGLVVLELIVALGIIATAMLPFAYSVVQEQRLARAYYYRAVAMAIVDGEMETLLAGEWQVFAPGARAYAVRADAAKNLPPGQFTLSLTATELRLEWRPVKLGQGGGVVRIAPIPKAKLELDR